MTNPLKASPGLRLLRKICCVYIVATRKTRYVFDNEKGLGCGLNKGMMYRLICFREQSNYDSKSAEMFQYGDINQHVSNHVENVILLTKVNSEK